MVKSHGEEMPCDVESMGAEGGVADTDEIEEIQQLTHLLDVEQDTGLLKSQVIDVSSDEESDGDKDSIENTLYLYAFMEKRLLYHA